MHGPSLIVAEREETNKRVSAEVGRTPSPLGEGWGEGAKLRALRTDFNFPLGREAQPHVRERE